MENRDQKEYSTNAMLALSAVIEKDVEAFNWLMENGYKELAALADVLVYGQHEPLEWLKTYRFNNIVSFIGALQEDEDAINYLMTHEGKKWAATAEMVNGNDSAPDWLQQFFPAFRTLGQVLINNAGSRRGRGIGGFGGGSFGSFGRW